ncbi:8-amino-7-oxononanoate synthase [Shewanella fidelis]|uniref:8-amino-7-ketopelargonate synthase n=1 Tax=Shewanella fidelis TaxID=173509 RepID=A0AAW8NLI7_9GAMM|nr:8-amino-7-oxononanoate synthase [Shewanella fidelis]MDR8523561.1 8-amino-7-oxononanoate synthase [Shewanella fidelis]MDW4810108.1 8-amino-7-oxononanoate synthase [Shewanella fidelis]MDW4814253.1 8-amino-7-oxononanoate synthase [Shewanella fidelis]MDW4818344.1 8-amino-7-oxononanoate synthase [Shewanella fidelis]MDW4824004.1 8-amino-7-oxononanoate synthase [Shewanella fidelis]
MSESSNQFQATETLATRIVDRNLALKQQGLLRQRIKLVLDPNQSNYFEVDALPYVNFSSNDYLGLATSNELTEALYQGAKDYGVGSTASSLVVGYTQAHAKLEQALCDVTGHEAALLFCSGFSANNALMKTLFEANDLVVADKLIHASVIDGIQDSGAKLKRFSHNDVESAKSHFERFKPTALITESVFSMDGDIAPLVELSALCQQHGAWLIVDDAHGFGVIGEDGFGATRLNADIKIDAQLVTFGKALGGQGAAILGSQALIDFLVANARHYIYSTALSPASAAAAYTALTVIETQPELRAKLDENINYFRKQCQENNIELTGSTTAIQPIILGDSAKTMAVAKRLKEHGFWLGAIRPPTVPQGGARLRLTLNANHCQQDISALVNVLADILNND